VDIQLYARVLWRFRVLVLVGFVLALTLATLSVVRVGSSGISYRDSELWVSKTRVGVTQNGFPWGRLFAENASSDAQTRNGGIPIANPARFNELAVLYAELATSDSVRRLIRKAGPLNGDVLATVVKDPTSGVLLPMIELQGLSTSPEDAVTLARRSARALSAYLEQQQRANHVPSSDRVVLQQIMEAREAEINQPRSKTMPVVIFLALVFATVGLAFLLENLRPRPQTSDEQTDRGLARPVQRRTA
jgi:hypothetical protein